MSKTRQNALRIAFFSVKGGVGRSTLLMHWAMLLAEKGLKVLVIDGDLEAPSLDIMLGIEPLRLTGGDKFKTPTLTSLLNQLHQEKRSYLRNDAELLKNELNKAILNVSEIWQWLAKGDEDLKPYDNADHARALARLNNTIDWIGLLKDKNGKIEDLFQSYYESTTQKEGGLWLLPSSRIGSEICAVRYTETAVHSMSEITRYAAQSINADIILMDTRSAISDPAAITMQSMDVIINVMLPRMQHAISAITGERWLKQQQWNALFFRIINKTAENKNNKNQEINDKSSEILEKLISFMNQTKFYDSSESGVEHCSLSYDNLFAHSEMKNTDPQGFYNKEILKSYQLFYTVMKTKYDESNEVKNSARWQTFFGNEKTKPIGIED